MASSNLKRSSECPNQTYQSLTQAHSVAAARDAQARRKKNKTSKTRRTADQALSSDKSEALMEEATDVEVEEFEDDGNTWKSATVPVTPLVCKTAYCYDKSFCVASDPSG